MAKRKPTASSTRTADLAKVQRDLNRSKAQRTAFLADPVNYLRDRGVSVSRANAQELKAFSESSASSSA